MKLILFSIIHSFYIIYVLNYFKTTYNFAHPITYFNNSMLYHPIGKSNKPSSKVCKLGNILSWWLASFIIIRSLFMYKYKKLMKYITFIVLILGVILSMLNLNVVIYLIPHFIIEILYIKYL